MTIFFAFTHRIQSNRYILFFLELFRFNEEKAGGIPCALNHQKMFLYVLHKLLRLNVILSHKDMR
jgi:hypothetical protein